MKPKTVIFFVIIVAMLINLAGIFYFYVISSNILEEKAIQHLQTAAESRASHIETFLEGKKGRAIDFSSDGFIKNKLIELRQGADILTIANELKEHFIVNKFPTDDDLFEIDVLDANGIVIGTTQIEEELGEDFSQKDFFVEGKKEAYIKDVFYDDEFDRNAIAFSAPIIDKGEFLGVVVIKMGLEALADITIDRTGLGETGEIYIINSDGYLITPSRFLSGNEGLLTQVVDTENSKKCFEGLVLYGVFDEEELAEHSKTSGGIIFEDYRGEVTLGVHSHVIGQTWCLLAQIDESEVLKEPRQKLLVVSLFILLVTALFLFLLAHFSGRFLDKRIKLRRGKYANKK